MAANNAIETFFKRNQAYFWTALGLGIGGSFFVFVLLIVDWNYFFRYTIALITEGNYQGVLDPPASNLEVMKNAAFGPVYDAFAPEIIRGSNERQLLIWYLFLFEAAIFALMYVFFGRKSAVITRPNDTVEVFTPFQRLVIWSNVAIVVFLIVSGFNITWALRSEGGMIPYYLRSFHEIVGLAWIPLWLVTSIMTFKDCPILRKHSAFQFFMPGRYKPFRRIIWFFYVTMGGGLILSGFFLWFLHPNALTNAELIQLKRTFIYFHFGTSLPLMFFLLDFAHSVTTAIRGNLGYLWTGRFPREHLEQLDPEVLEDLKRVGRA
ncbi:MAG: cytochrome b/b6 domain-containing protein [Helicobacteraceae bacterium]|jgi:formate dehydrogenase subunit gamma|nr:cytochrome b/b6 domain-containing protein [Helicobacteraceae bacterium]